MARVLSWVMLILVLASSLFLSFFISNTMRTALINSQEEYALLLAQNMNKQIFRRFTLPVAMASGRVALADPDQYRLLDEVVLSLMHGLQIDRIRIYDENLAVTYSTDKEEVGRLDLATPGISYIFEGTPNHFDVISRTDSTRAFFSPTLEPGSFLLRTVYPLSIDQELGLYTDEAPVLGALEIIQDVTSHYAIVTRSMWLVLLGFTISSLVLFIIIQFVARKAEATLSERMARTRQLEAELHQSEKMATMGHMVASIAHEIRNPLGIIRSSSEFMLTRNKQKQTIDASVIPMLEAIYDESCRLGTTVNDFLDYARPRDPNLQPVNILQLIQKALLFLQNEFEASAITVDLHVPENLMIDADADLLYRAIYNILVNAQQAIGKEGNISVRGHSEKGGVYLVFLDTGPGFPPDFLKKPIEPFFTTKDTGTGLGLSIVQAIIQSHGATLSLDNTDEHNASVTIFFPSKR